MGTTEASCAVRTGRSRFEAEVLLAQLRGIDAWASAHRELNNGDATATSREQRLDLARRRDVVQRQRLALIDRTVESEREIGPFLAAGATTAYTRRVPPTEIAAGLLELLAVPVPRSGVRR